MKIEPDQLYVPNEVAVILRCGKSNVYGLISAGAMASIRVGTGSGGLRIRGSDLLAFIEERTTGGPSPTGSFKYLKGFAK